MAKGEKMKSVDGGLAGLKDSVAARGIRLSQGKFNMKGLAPAQLSKEEDIKERSSFIKGQIEVLRTSISELGEVLSDPDRARRQAEEVTQYEGQIMAFVTKEIPDEWKAECEEITVATMAAMVEHYPATGDALRRIADMGIAIGFLVPASDKTSKAQSVGLPTSNGGGRWEAKELTTHFPGGRGILPDIRKKSEESLSARREERDEKIESLREGTIPFEEALANGSGEAVFFVPDEKTAEGRFYPGGNVRVRIEDEKVFPVAAVGKCKRKVEGLVAEGGAYIMISSLSSERMEIVGRRYEENVFYALLAFHGLCHRAWKHLVEKKARRETAETWHKSETVDARGFLSGFGEGRTYIFLPGWQVGKGKDAFTHRNVQFVLARDRNEKIWVDKCHPEHEELFSSCREGKAEVEHEYPLPQMLAVVRSKLARASMNDTNETDNG